VVTGGTWLCIAEGFPALPFLIDEDVSSPDGAVRCRRVGEDELIQLGWRVARAINILRRVPLIF
jgi:hypothetical protein